MFYTQEERKTNGDGTGYIELQYCKKKKTASARKIVSARSMLSWQDDSLYVHTDDIDDFYTEYGNIFVGGLYNNTKWGHMDILGINYYSPMQVYAMIHAIEVKEPRIMQCCWNG